MKACFTLLARANGKFVTVKFKKGNAAIPEGVSSYYVRYTKDGKRHTVSVGKDLKTAVIRLTNMERGSVLESRGLQVPPLDDPDPSGRLTLAQAREKFYADKGAGLMPKSKQVYDVAINAFIACCKKPYIDQVEKQDMIDYKNWLMTQPAPKRTHGNPGRTQANRLNYVSIFLKAFDKGRLLPRREFPKFHGKKIVAHTDAELALLYSHANSEERFLLDFFIGSMVRAAEGYHCKYEQLTGTTLTVYGKQHKTRTVEISPRLAAAIADRRERNNSEYIFPNNDNGPHIHLLRILQNLGKRAGAKFHTELHKLRKTGASRRYRAGVPLMSLMAELGHTSLAVTQIYLADIHLDGTKKAVAESDFILKPQVVRTGTSGD